MITFTEKFDYNVDLKYVLKGSETFKPRVSKYCCSGNWLFKIN